MPPLLRLSRAEETNQRQHPLRHWKIARPHQRLMLRPSTLRSLRKRPKNGPKPKALLRQRPERMRRRH